MTPDLEFLAANLIIGLSLAGFIWASVLIEERRDRVRVPARAASAPQLARVATEPVFRLFPRGALCPSFAP